MNNGIRLLFTVGVLILSTPTYPQSSTSVLSSQDILQLYKDVKNLNFDESRVANVENVTFAKDRAIFAFQKGTFYFVEPVREHITGAIFLGEGSLSLDPPTEIERAQVRRFLEADSLLETFSAAYLRFTGQAAHDLIKDLTFTQAEIPDKVTELHEEISDYFLKERGINLASGVLGDLLNGAEEGLFFAVLEKKQPELNFSSYLAFIFEPNASEEVALFQYFPRRSKKPFYTVCSFHRTNDYQSGDAFFSTVEEDDDALQISHYKMQVKLEKSGKLNTEAELTYSPLVDNLRFLTFVLYQELEVDSVNNVLGETLAFIQEEKEAAFSVILDEPLLPQTEQTLTVYYSGDALEPANGNLLLKNKVYWYPRYGYLVPATYDITFEYPSDWQVIAVGAKIERWEDGSSAFSRWLEDTPAFGAAFAFGYFDSTTYDSENVLPIKVYSSHSRATSIRAKIGGDVANSLYFFERLLGDYPYQHMNVAETPGLGSQGFPALLFLTSHTFAREIEGVMEALRGHEVAHQWWGNLVGWETYHDQWLSEGLAEYSGALITQFLLNDDKRFFEVLEGWRTDLLEKGHIAVSLGLRRFGFSKQDLLKSQGLEAGPIWLGRRLGTKYPIDYYLITYEKAAYVIHMLRTLLRDFETGSDEKFFAMLADFVNTYKQQRASTNDFIEIVEKHFGEDMGWFFDQWLFGTDVPTYIYCHDVSEVEGKFRVDIKVRQEDVSPNFKMYIPVGVETATQKSTQLILMDEEEKGFRLGPFPDLPQEIVFNDFAGVLARIREK